eukprot:tig00000383_g24723.t1
MAGRQESQAAFLRAVRLAGAAVQRVSLDLYDLDRPFAEAVLRSAAAYCPAVRHLAVRNAQSVPAGSLAAAVAAWPLLEGLDLAGCVRLRDADLAAVLASAAGERGVADLCLDGCTALGSRFGWAVREDLRAVSLCDLPLSAASVNRLALACHALERLDLSSSPDACADATAASVAAHCPALAALSMAVAPELGAPPRPAPTSPSARPPRPAPGPSRRRRERGRRLAGLARLEELDLEGWSAFTDAGVAALAAGPAAAALRRAVFAACRELSAASAARLAAACPSSRPSTSPAAPRLPGGHRRRSALLPLPRPRGPPGAR